MIPKIQEEAFLKTPKTQTEAIHTQSKGKAKLEDKESSNETSKNIDWKLVRAIQRYQKEKEEDYGLDDASPLSEEILIETFYRNFFDEVQAAQFGQVRWDNKPQEPSSNLSDYDVGRRCQQFCIVLSLSIHPLQQI